MSSEEERKDDQKSDENQGEKPSTSRSEKSKKDQKKDQKESSGGGGSTLPDLVSNFVRSLERALTTEDEKVERKLASLDLEEVAKYIKERQPSVVFLVGAGISTSAGIPDFRSPGTGLYDNLQKYNLPDPQAIFEIGFFKRNPEPFFQFAKDLFPEKLKPTPSHYLIRMMQDKGLLRRCYSQNIDALEDIAGIKPEKTVLAHGSHSTGTCMNSKCKKKYGIEWIMAKLRNKEELVAKCDHCKTGVVKPDIVFFGESLPKRFFTSVIEDMPKCELLIIMGTSLVVHPVAGLIREVDDAVPRLLINLEPAGQGGSGGLAFNRSDNTRDVFWQGTCDDGARQLVDLLGWKDEFDKLVEKEWAKIEKEHAAAT
ncbi:transcriptional regulatorSir2 family protein, partial [Aphelenchoides avenae]